MSRLASQECQERPHLVPKPEAGQEQEGQGDHNSTANEKCPPIPSQGKAYQPFEACKSSSSQRRCPR